MDHRNASLTLGRRHRVSAGWDARRYLVSRHRGPPGNAGSVRFGRWIIATWLRRGMRLGPVILVAELVEFRMVLATPDDPPDSGLPRHLTTWAHLDLSSETMEGARSTGT